MTDKILMGADNPDGAKLEDLLRQLIEEIDAKTEKIVGDDRYEARLVRANNGKITKFLYVCLSAQIMNMEILNDLAPNEGPLGKPRIGPGSE